MLLKVIFAPVCIAFSSQVNNTTSFYHFGVFAFCSILKEKALPFFLLWNTKIKIIPFTLTVNSFECLIYLFCSTSTFAFRVEFRVTRLHSLPLRIWSIRREKLKVNTFSTDPDTVPSFITSLINSNGLLQAYHWNLFVCSCCKLWDRTIRVISSNKLLQVHHWNLFVCCLL